MRSWLAVEVEIVAVVPAKSTVPVPCGANDKFVLLAGVLRVVTVASVLIRTLPVPFGLILRSVFVPVVVIVLLVPPINILPVPSGPIVKLPLLAGVPIVVTSNVLAVATITLPVPFGSKLICPFVSVEIIVLPLTLILSTVKVVKPATAPSKLTVIVSAELETVLTFVPPRILKVLPFTIVSLEPLSAANGILAIVPLAITVSTY